MSKLKIGVMGSFLEENHACREKARSLGSAIAKSGCILMTGACTGLPQEAVRAAKENSGLTIGISPATSTEEHTSEYESPADNFDALVFTGFGHKGRNVILVRSCDALIFVSGGTGTLNEFTIAYDEGKVCGVLTGSGGVADEIKGLEEKCFRGRKRSGKVIYNSDPGKLVEAVIGELNGRNEKGFS